MYLRLIHFFSFAARAPEQFGDLADDATGISRREHASWYVARDNGASADYCARAYAHAREIIAPPPTHTSDPMSIGFPNSSRRRRRH
jgi:hypothetical protein